MAALSGEAVAVLLRGFGVDFVAPAMKNGRMVLRGHMQNGVVILEGKTKLPEGAVVTVTYPAPVASPPVVKKRRVEFPLVRSEHPGSVDLTNERITEILAEEDLSP